MSRDYVSIPCPACGSINVEQTRSFDLKLQRVVNACICYHCNHQWKVLYTGESV